MVVIAFAGHGSPDGNLVLSDTDPANFPGTALSMAALAEAFKTTKARAVPCILDCCFSGQAPARVLETVARPRSVFVFTGIAGEGRILLAACAANESAWEQPGTGHGLHGLLTYAVIEAWTGAPSTAVSFPEIAEEIPRMSGSFEEFAGYGFPPEIARQWATDFPAASASRPCAGASARHLVSERHPLVVAPPAPGSKWAAASSGTQISPRDPYPTSGRTNSKASGAISVG